MELMQTGKVLIDLWLAYLSLIILIISVVLNIYQWLSIRPLKKQQEKTIVQINDMKEEVYSDLERVKKRVQIIEKTIAEITSGIEYIKENINYIKERI